MYLLHFKFFDYLSFFVCRDSLVSIETPYRLDESGNRIPVETSFAAPVQADPETRTVSYRMSTGSLSPPGEGGVKLSRRGADSHHPSSADVKERVEVYLYSPSGPSWHVIG
jgi:hypothetical protein